MNTESNEERFNKFLDELHKSGRIDDKEYGIAKLARDKPYKDLSTKQKYIYDRVMGENTIKSCKLCGEPVTWSEMLFVLDDPDHYCPPCRHTWDKIDKE